MQDAPHAGMHPTAVVFDVGNVLYGWDPYRLYRSRFPEEAAMQRFLAETDFFAWHEELDGGRCAAEATADLCSRFPAYANHISAWSEHFAETVTGPVEGVHAIVADLHEAGVPLYAITNFPADFWTPFHAGETELFDRFRDIVVSGAVKLLKPDPAIYHLARNRFGLTAGEALFIDDREANVEGARAVGMHAHLFTGAGDLRRRLEAEELL